MKDTCYERRNIRNEADGCDVPKPPGETDEPIVFDATCTVITSDAVICRNISHDNIMPSTLVADMDGNR